MKLILSCLLVFFLVSCKKEIDLESFSLTTYDPASATRLIPIDEHTVFPVETDSSITTTTAGSALQYAYVPRRAMDRVNKLFVFIPGTTAGPDDYKLISQVGAKAGYHTIGIAYSNLLPIEFYALGAIGDGVVENILEEYLTGNNTSSRVDIGKQNGFENRIIKMIQYMDEQFPTENWSQYLDANGQLRWNLMSVSGHSQGSDHSMYMTRKRNLLRGGLFAGPGSFRLLNGNYPTFMRGPGLTPPENVFGLAHIRDEIRGWNDVRPTWATLAVPGLPTSVDNNNFRGANQLTTNISGTSSAHSAMVSDAVTPLRPNGVPEFANVWIYMCFPR
jgi:hypothetical protein